MKEYEWVEMKDMEWDYILRRMKWIEDPEITTKIYAWLESLIDWKDKLIFDLDLDYDLEYVNCLNCYAVIHNRWQGSRMKTTSCWKFLLSGSEVNYP